ncbi:hypothetical protein KP509_30G013000 [Ceratopteris richardii]|uniref:Uncharacterized protein n=1 Tax=Ceratopteris richardii TaxID=49495 RepID=A0A8T2R265_CERRI|nr:hypothetical protein KP509_30G013000 [Ceratopteris richardii]
MGSAQKEKQQMSTDVTDSARGGAGGREELYKVDGKGVPVFAQPWVELGKLEERQKWQTLAIDLMQNSLSTEIDSLRNTLDPHVPANSVPDLKEQLNKKVITTQENISHLIDQYKGFFLEEPWNECKQSRQQVSISGLLHEMQQVELGNQELHHIVGSTSEIVEVRDED